MTDFKIEKRGFKFDMGKEWFLLNSGFPRKGHWEEIPLTDEDRKAHKRAKRALKELEKNRWVSWPRMDDEIYIDPLEPRRNFIAEETPEEWMARWEEAGCPDVHSERWGSIMTTLVNNAREGFTKTGFHRA